MSGAAPTPLGELVEALAEGLARPLHAWEAAAAAAALALAWIGARLCARLLLQRPAAGPLGPLAAGALRGPAAAADLRRVLFPLLGLALLWVAEGLLRWRHVIGNAGDARLMRLAMSLVGALAAVRVLFALLRRVLRQSQLNAVIERAIGIAALLGVALYATGAWDDVVGWMSSSEIPLGNTARVSLWSILVGSVTTLVSLLAAMWLGSLVEERLDRQTALEPNLRTVLGRVARALLLTVALLFGLALSGIDLTVLSVFGGALGVGLGLGLQRIASNYVSGFILLLDHSLRIGDMVSVDRYYGQVTQISTRYTKLRSSDGTEAIVPNEMLVSSPVVNLTLGDSRVCLTAEVVVGPQADLPRVQALMAQASATVPRVLAEPAPSVLLKDLSRGNLQLEVNFWIADPAQGRQNVQSDVLSAVFLALNREGIELAAPRGDFLVHPPR